LSADPANVTEWLCPVMALPTAEQNRRDLMFYGRKAMAT
jgi:hypothetical protein